jgi:hypothetical protein
MVCIYCLLEECECGAKEYKKKTREDERFGPIFYNGFIVWSVREYYARRVKFVFYKGNSLVDVVVVTDEMLTLAVPEGQDSMPFIFEIFEAQQGEQETIEIDQWPEFVLVRREQSQRFR